MANISNFLNKIRTAIYGKEVRGSLADGLEAVNKETENATKLSKETSKKQDALDKKYDDQIANMTNENPSISELVDFRTSGTTGKSYTTAGKRADDIEAQLTDVGINVKNFVDHFSDATEGIRAAELAAFFSQKPLFFPRGHEFETTDTIVIRENIDVIMHSPIVFDSEEIKPALVIGTHGIVNYAEELVLNVKRKNQSDWEDEDDIGVQLINCNTTKIDTEKVEGFTIGVEMLGSGTGFSYCQLYLGKLYNNKIDLNLTNETYEGKMGWCNENSFFAGRFSSFNGVNDGKDRCAVRITTKNKDVAFNYNNNNVFYKPSFEKNQASAGQAEALPILIDAGRYNRFYDVRDENNGDYLARTTNGSYYNYFGIGYSDRTKTIDDLTDIATNKIEQARDVVESKGSKLLFSSGNLIDKSNIYETPNNNLYIPNLSVGTTSNDQIYMSRSDIKKQGLFVQVTGSSGIGVFVETTQVKTFTIDYLTQNNYHGRLYIVCYDAGGNIINGEHLLKQHDIRQQTIQSSNFGGSVRINLDGYAKTFTVSNEVRKIRVLFSGVETIEPIRIKSFSISADGGGDAVISSGLEDRVQPGLSYALNKPPNGIYESGKTIYNVAVGAPGAPVGWISYGASKNMVEFGQVSKSVSISNPPAFIGQESLSGPHWYKAIGTSSSADWKRITN